MSAPQSIDRFQILRELGRGGMGVVFEVRHPDRPDARFALKLVIAQDVALLERFVREAQLLARIRHTNVIPIHASGQSARGPYMVMPFVEGENLNARIKRSGGLDPREAAGVMAKLADAVASLHQVGVIHRDLKPENALLGGDGEPVLIDFGLARAEDAETLTRTGMLLGTPAYMAPEQAEGAGTVALDERCDVYGLGATFFALLAGHAPFSGSQLQVIRAVLEEEPPWGDVGSSVANPDAWAVCRKAMAKKPEDRYPTARALRDDLERVARGEAPENAGLPRRGRGKQLLAGLGALAIVGGLGAWAAFGGSTVGPEEARIRIEVTSPTQEEHFTRSRIEVQGRVVPPQDGASIYVNERRVVPDTEGRFVHELHLEEGENSLELVLKRGAEVIAGPLTRLVTLSEQPDWYVALPPERRAPYPLPAGVRFGTDDLEYVNETDGSVLVYCPPGTFRMGTSKDWATCGSQKPGTGLRNDWPAHDVTLSRGFFIGRYELTWKQAWAFCDATGRARLEPIQGDPERLGSHPVHGINWKFARAYCEWARLRLPTEAEWEFAARGPGKGPVAPWLGPDDPMPTTAERFLLYQAGGIEGTRPVGSYRKVMSPFGCYDMAGNVGEIVSDAPRNYTPDPVEDPFAEHPHVCTLKSAGWNSVLYLCQVTARWAVNKTAQRSNDGLMSGANRSDIGFRIARDAR